MVVAKKNSLRKKSVYKNLFVACMLAWPLLHLFVFWGIVNFNSITLTFKEYRVLSDTYVFVGFNNYKRVFADIVNNTETTRRYIINSLGYFPVTCLISLPLALFSSYFLYKKMPLANVFRVIFFLPSIVPIVVLSMVYKFSFDANFGIVDGIFKLFNIRAPNWFGMYPSSQYMIYLYCIWAGIGFNCILLSGAISRLPQDLFEYNRLEGVGFARELFQIVIPLIWPTITTTFILGMTSVFSVMIHPLMIMPNDADTQTISLTIYNAVSRGSMATLPYVTTFGLTLSLMGLPFILLARFGMERCWRGVEF